MKSTLPFFRHSFILLSLCWLCLTARAQQNWDVNRARAHVDTLTSATFAGRGYQDNGHVMAANYIADFFDAHGVGRPPGKTPVEDLRMQKFGMGINFIDSLAMSCGKTRLVPGRDFILNSASGSGSGAVKKVRDIGYGMPDDFAAVKKGDLVVVREGLPPAYEQDAAMKAKFREWSRDEVKAGQAMTKGASAVIVLKKKLTASLSQERQDFPVFEVLAESWPAKAKNVRYKAMTHFGKVTSQNVLGYVPGEIMDTVIIVSAHYDHLGRQQEAVFPGANDNASGTGVLLQLADYFAHVKHRYSMLFIAFSGEEVGLVGSEFYVRNPVIPLARTKFILNLDLMGNGNEGITAVAGADFPAEFNRLVALNDTLKAVPIVKSRGNAPNSDHYHFVSKGVHGMFIYTLGGPPHYHDVNDTAAALQYSKYPELMELLSRFLLSF